MKSLWNWLTKFFKKANDILPTLQRVALEALPIVEAVAQMTPTRVDDEIIALFQRYEVPYVTAYLALPVDQRGPALLAAATHAVASIWPNVPTSQIQTAIQLAVVQVKNPAIADV